MGATRRAPGELEIGLAAPVLTLPARLPEVIPVIGPAAEPLLGRLGFRLPPKMKPRSVMVGLPGRCLERGCVYPALPIGDGRCLHHLRQQREPEMYCSHQPSSAVAAREKFGPPRSEELETDPRGRGLDRRRLMAERERFLND